MATKTTPAPAGARSKTSDGAVDYLRHALEDLGHARDEAGQDARERIDAAVESIRDATREFTTRAQDQLSEWEHVLARETDEVLVEFGRLAVRAQRTPEGLREISAEVRRRKAELIPGPGKPAS